MNSIIYLLYIAGILSCLTLFYWIFLRRETFFLANRGILLGAMALAIALPLLPTPSLMVHLKTDLVESFQPTQIIEEIIPSQEVQVAEKSTPINTNDITINNTKIQSASEPSYTPSITIWEMIKWIYLIGLGIMTIRFLVQLFGVYQHIKNSEVTKGAGYFLATSNKDISPFSFWKYIVLNPNKYNEESFLHILEHERIHIAQRHTIDMVLAELFLIVQWFNPLAWWHRHLLDQNLEFLVDQTLLENGENKQSYQYHLVQVAVPNIPLSISSNYNYSQLKTRINMMNLQRSSLAASWKYALLLPIAFLLLVAFTDGKEQDSEPILTVPESSYVIITPKATQEELSKLQEELYQLNYVLSFDELVYKDGQIEAINATLDYNDERGLIIPLKWNGEDDRRKFGVIVNEIKSRFGVFLDEIIIKDLANRIPKEQIFIAGDFPLDKVLAEMRQHLQKEQLEQETEFQKNIKDPHWPGKLTKFGRVYGPEILDNHIEEIKAKIARDNYPTNYYLNGIERNESVLETPIEEIEYIRFNEYRYRNFDKKGNFIEVTPWNYEVRIKRKGKISTKKKKTLEDLEEIIIIITEEASIEEIKEVQEELLNYGVRLNIENIQFNQQSDRITSLTAKMEAGGNSGTSIWDNDSADYNYMVFYFNPNTGHTHNGVNAEIKPIPEEAKLFIVGKAHTKKTLQFLRSQSSSNVQKFLEINKQNNQNPNWQGYPQQNSHTERNLSPESIATIKQEIKNANPATISYKVDGMEWGVEALDIPATKMETLKWSEWLKVKYDDEGKEQHTTIEKLEIAIIRKANPLEVKPDYKLTMQETFRPNGTDTYSIDGIEQYPQNKIRIMNKYGELIYDAQPYKNDWTGVDRQGQILKPSIYMVMLQLEEKERIMSHVEILPQKENISADFIHEPNTTHYLISPSTASEFGATKDFLRTNFFMRNMQQRISSLNEGPHAHLIMIRGLDNYKKAVELGSTITSWSDKPANLQLYPISKANYQKLLEQPSLDKYIDFFETIH